MDNNMRIQRFISEIAEDIFLNHKSTNEAFMIFTGEDMIDCIVENALAISRRAFKASDIKLLIVLDEEHEGEKGIVFTETKIHVWKGEGEERFEVAYDEIEDIDYGENCVIIVCHEKEYIIEVNGKNSDINYPRKLYNYIADVLEELEDEK